MAAQRKPRPFRCITSAADTNGKYSEVMIDVRPGKGPPAHTHSKEAERFFVKSGRFRIEIAGQAPVEKGPGEEAYGPIGVEHSFINISESDAVIIVRCEPPGFERSFEEYEDARDQGPKGLADRMEAIDLKYGITGIDRRAAAPDTPEQKD